MINQRNKIRSLAVYIGDLLAAGLAFLCAYEFRGALPQDPQHPLFPLAMYLNLLWPLLPIWSILFYLKGLYHAWQGEGFWKETWEIIQAIFISSWIRSHLPSQARYQLLPQGHGYKQLILPGPGPTFCPGCIS